MKSVSLLTYSQKPASSVLLFTLVSEICFNIVPDQAQVFQVVSSLDVFLL